MAVAEEREESRPMIGDRRTEQTIGLVILAILAIGCVLVLRPFFTAICFALILVVATYPAFQRVERVFGGDRNMAALIMTLFAGLLLVLPPLAIAPNVQGHVASAVQAVRVILEDGVPAPPAWIAEVQLIGPPLHERWQSLAAGGGGEATARLHAALVWLRHWLIGAGLSLGATVAQLVLALVISFFLYRDGVAVGRGLTAAAQRIAGDRGPRLLHVANATIRGVVFGVLGTSLLQALLLMLGFWLAGIPAAVLLGLVSLVLAFVPLGPALVWGPAAAWLVLGGETGWAVFLIVWSLLAGLVTDNVIRPWLISRGIAIPLILIILGVLGGMATLGFLGLFLGPTLLALGYEMIREWNAGVYVAEREPEMIGRMEADE
jgi:predicted PurR-regulated permease PerM